MQQQCENNFYTNDELSYILKHIYDKEVFKSKDEIENEKSQSKVIEGIIEENHSCSNETTMESL